MMDERSKEMRDLLFSLPSAPEVRDNMKDAMRDCTIHGVGIYHTSIDAIELKNAVRNAAQAAQEVIAKTRRCLCCGGIGINHDE